MNSILLLLPIFGFVALLLVVPLLVTIDLTVVVSSPTWSENCYCGVIIMFYSWSRSLRQPPSYSCSPRGDIPILSKILYDAIQLKVPNLLL